jgi:CheY-like chemotaxis protein
VLNLLGGEIRVESVKEEGSTFIVSLPVEHGILHSDGSCKPLINKELNGLPVMLIADDESTHRIYLDSFLKKYTSRIFQARNGREAVDLCREHPEIQLVMMDIKMPVLDGFEATREIKSFRNDILIIAFTAYAMNRDRKAALDAGCDDYVAKPTDSDGLLEVLKKHGFVS